MPTVPTPETVLRTRFALVVAARVIAAVFVFWWIMQVVQRLVGTYVIGQRAAAMVRAGLLPREPVLEPIMHAAVLPVCVTLIAILTPRLARLLVPFPKPGCPFCGHRALPESGTKCTECGRELPEQLRR